MVESDFRYIFELNTDYYVVLSPNLKVVAVNDVYLKGSMTKRDEVVGKDFFEAFANATNGSHVDGIANIKASFQRVLKTKLFDTLFLQKYNFQMPGSEIFGDRYFSFLNTPLLDKKKEVKYIIHRMEDVTEYVYLKKKEAKEVELLKNQEIYLKQVEENEEQFRMLVERAKDYAIFMVDATGHVVSWNEGAEQIKGYSAEEIAGKHISIFYTEEGIRDGEPEQHLKIAKEKGRFENEGWRVRKDGTKFWEEAVFTALYDKKRKFKGYSKITRDLTERKRAEEKLTNANKELAFQNTEKEKRAEELIIANKELLFQNEVKEKRARELIIANKELAFQNIEKEKRAGELFIANKELAFQNTEKEKRAGELIIANKELAFQNEEKEKRARELIIANKELAFQNTEKEKRAGELIIANKELAFQNEEKEKRARELIIANEELAFQNEEKEKRAGELIIANEELAFQNTEKEKRAEELIIANEELAFQNTEKEKRAGELIIANEELAFQNTEKEKRAGELITANGKLKEGEDDIRKLNKELEQNLTQITDVNKELEAFSYSVSHDLRAPLRAINGYAQMLEEDHNKSLSEDGIRKLGVIMGSAKKMGDLIDDLLTFSRLGRKQIQKSTINMTALVEAAELEISKTVQHKATIKIHDLKPTWGDYTLLYQVMINLLSNAIKYSSKLEMPVIEIASEEKNDEIIYSIKDNGAGFDMLYIDKLFNVFQRLHTSAEFEGTGIGLAIVQRIVNKHGGKVWAVGKINEGAVFYFTLPKKQI